MPEQPRNKIDSVTHRKMTTWLVAQSLIIICAVIISFLSVELITNYFFVESDRKEDFYKILYRSGGTIIPMAVALGLLNNYLSQLIYHYIDMIAVTPEKIADGNFKVRLNSKKAGPFSEVYKNINKTAEELSNVELLKTDFINSYSHEFKTPITSIKGFAELLLEEDVDDTTKDQYLGIIAEEANRLAKMADTTILLSKLSNQTIVTDKEFFSLDEQIRKCSILFLQQANDKKIEFKINLADCQYKGNQDLMEHIWINLLNNAFKFTPEKGKVTIDLTKEVDKLVLKIVDSGMGMSEEIQKKIFNQYYQGSTKGERQGLGLGLAIVKKIVLLCEGVISVESSEKQGTTFVVRLPIEN